MFPSPVVGEGRLLIFSPLVGEGRPEIPSPLAGEGRVRGNVGGDCLERRRAANFD